MAPDLRHGLVRAVTATPLPNHAWFWEQLHAYAPPVPSATEEINRCAYCTRSDTSWSGIWLVWMCPNCRTRRTELELDHPELSASDCEKRMRGR